MKVLGVDNAKLFPNMICIYNTQLINRRHAANCRVNPFGADNLAKNYLFHFVMISICSNLLKM